MLKSIYSAFEASGKSQSEIARRMNCSRQIICHYFGGKNIVPIHKRKRLDEALEVQVNWPEYELEFEALLPAAPPAPDLPEVAPPAAAPAPRPPKPRADPPKTPATPPRRLTATPPSQTKAPRPSAPPAAPEPKRGFLAGFLAPDTDLFA